MKEKNCEIIIDEIFENSKTITVKLHILRMLQSGKI